MANTSNEDTPVRRAALLLMSLGEQDAIEVFKHLGPKEVQKLGFEMASVSKAGHSEVDMALKQCRTEAASQVNMGAADEYVRTVLTKALGSDKAANLLERILQGGENNGIEALKWMDSASVAELIKNEHPQIIATILVHLERDQAGEILGCFTERIRNDIVLRVATLEGIQPAALRELNDVLTGLLAGSDNLKKSNLGGVESAAEILNFMGSTVESSALSMIRETDPELAQKIQDKMFTFENLLDLEDRGIQLVLREIDPSSLVVALKGTTAALRDKIFKNMSARAGEMLKDDLESKGPVRLSEVESVQKDILKLVRRLADEGQLMLGGKGSEEGMVV